MRRTTTKRATSTPSAAGRHQQLKRALEERRGDIDRSVRGQLSQVREDRAGTNAVDVLDEGEAADVDVQEDIELSLIQMKLETIERIDEAIARLESGRYGRCIECGEDISEARLRALPFAVRCVDCEETREDIVRRERALLQRRMTPFVSSTG